MGQIEILNLMKLHKDKWFNAEELSNHFFIGKVSVNRCLLKLFEYRFVIRKKVTCKKGVNSFHHFEYKLRVGKRE